MRSLWFLPAALLLFISSVTHAQDSAKWNLQRCIEYAAKNNLTVLQGELNQQLNKNNYTQSYLNLLPSINAGITNDFTNGKQFNLAAFKLTTQTSMTFATSLSGDLTLFAGLQQVHNILRNKFNYEAAQYDLKDARNTAALNVTTAFLQIMLAQENMKVAENQRQMTMAQKESIARRVSAGMLPESNLLDIDAQLARDESNVAVAKNSYDLAVLALRLLLQLKPEDSFDVVLPQLQDQNITLLAEGFALTVYKGAVNTQPSILAEMARVKSAEYSTKAAKGALSPSISVNGNLYDYYNNQQKRLITGTTDYETVPLKDQYADQFRKSVSFTLAIPIFSKWQRMNAVQNAIVQQQGARLQLEARKNSLMQTIYQADADARAAASAYAASQKSYEASKRAFDAQNKRYGAGATTTLDYQTSKNNLAAVESELIRNKYTYIFRLKVLDFYQGKPITLE